MTDAIRIEGVTKTFGSTVAVRDLDLAVPTGSLCGFIGPNGAGKTTTIRMIMSIIFPDRGRLSVLGKDSAVESKDRIGYLPEERGVYRKMRITQFLRYMGRLKGVGGGALNRRIDDWLERVDLAEHRHKRCEELSKGMQQKVQFIASIIHDPELIILDEPFSGLDPVNMTLLRDLMLERHNTGCTIIFSTHVMHQAEQLCEHLFMIHRGRKVLDSPIDDIRRRFDPRCVLAEPIDEADGAASRLAVVPGVRTVDRGRHTLELLLEDGADAHRVMADAAAACPLRRLELKRPSLEEVFVGIVGAADAPPPSGDGHDPSRFGAAREGVRA